VIGEPERSGGLIGDQGQQTRAFACASGNDLGTQPAHEMRSGTGTIFS
jgi:hypothetical protein